MLTARVFWTLRERGAGALLRRLRESQFWSRERIRQYQLDKLLQLLRHAYAQVPFYERALQSCGARPEDIRSLEDFQRLPVLTKELIRENFDDLVARSAKQEDRLPNATGGSTGEPLQLLQDRQYQHWADAARMRGWYDMAGCRPGDRCAVLWGDVRDVKEDFSLGERIRGILVSGEVVLNSFNLSADRKRTFLRWCRWFRPKLLRGYVTAIKDFAEFLEDQRLSFPPLKGIILCAETVDADSQSMIERVFGAPSFNMYGGREVSLTAMECEAKCGLHEVSENNYVEFEPIDLPGHPGAGNLLVTNLNNCVMPLIRYRIGDIGVPSDRQSCRCGRGLPLIAKVIGRTTDVFEFHDGTRIAGEMFIHLMKEFPIRAYQFVQVSERQMVLRLTRADAQNEELRTSIRDAYRPYLPQGVMIEFEEVDRFERTPTGKFRFVYRQVPA